MLFVIPSNHVSIVGVLCVLEKGLNSSLASLQGSSNLSLNRLNPLETTKKGWFLVLKSIVIIIGMHMILSFKPLRSRNLEAKKIKTFQNQLATSLLQLWGTSPITLTSTRVLIHFCFPLSFRPLVGIQVN